MRRASATQVRDDFSDTISRVAHTGERVVVQRSGKDVAALVSIEDLTLLEELEDRIDIEEARRILAKEGDRSVPWSAARKRLGL